MCKGKIFVLKTNRIRINIYLWNWHKRQKCLRLKNLFVLCTESSRLVTIKKESLSNLGTWAWAIRYSYIHHCVFFLDNQMFCKHHFWKLSFTLARNISLLVKIWAQVCIKQQLIQNLICVFYNHLAKHISGGLYEFSKFLH